MMARTVVPPSPPFRPSTPCPSLPLLLLPKWTFRRQAARHSSLRGCTLNHRLRRRAAGSSSCQVAFIARFYDVNLCIRLAAFSCKFASFQVCGEPTRNLLKTWNDESGGRGGRHWWFYRFLNRVSSTQKVTRRLWSSRRGEV